MIRFAEPEDSAAVIDLWNRCFGDDRAFTDWFFQNRYCPEDTLLYLDGDTLCAMVQMLPYQLQKASETVAVTYIYGACTAPEYRRRGRMAELLQESFRLDQQKGRAASILIPAEPWLFGFYKKYGYDTAFWVSNQQLEADPQATIVGEIRPLTDADCAALDHVYRNCLTAPYLCRTAKDWEKQLQMFRDLGGMALGWYAADGQELMGYAFLWKNDDGLWAQELMGQHRETMIQMILQYCHADSMKVTFPGTEQRLGCIHYHDNSPVEPGYFNLLFN
ncbi:MAG: GNAT family N-acetyltransferase [Eubacteriales bacterium]|nr:GNAT family N-acetyltransferase [Eubacteriales bacterium]